MTYTLNVQTELEVLTCCNCGEMFAMTRVFFDKKHYDRQTFYCPAGHGQWFPGKTDTVLRKEAERAAANAIEEARVARADAEMVRVALQKERKAKAAAESRAKAALCPVPGCKRSFVQMDRHLHTKHPAYVHGLVNR